MFYLKTNLESLANGPGMPVGEVEGSGTLRATTNRERLGRVAVRAHPNQTHLT